jgi:nicotinic acid mononucleotide adenylyltransferase
VSEPDSIDTDDPDVLRAEILRLRDHMASIDARIEMLESLIATRDTQITEYDAEVNRLRDVVAQSTITRVRQAIDRRRP